MKSRGFAKGSYRLDGGRRWGAAQKMSKPTAASARERMIERELTDSIVHDIMGGSLAAVKQSNAYGELIENIKKGERTSEPAGSMANASRERMIERDSLKYRGIQEHPDLGRDKANRKAYPKR